MNTYSQHQDQIALLQYGKDAKPNLIALSQEKTENRLGDIQELIAKNHNPRRSFLAQLVP